MRGKHFRNKHEYRRCNKAEHREHVSNKSDNRVVCIATGRPKFLYPTLKKAELACSFSKDLQRPYYCKGCCGYHTTSKTKDEYYETLEEIGIKEVARAANPSRFIYGDAKSLRKMQQRREKLERNAGRIKTEVEHTMRVAMWLELPFYL